MLDTGCCNSAIDANLAKTIPGKLVPWPWGKLTGISGTDVTPKYAKLNVPIKFRDNELTLHFGVYENQTPKIILGMDFIRKADIFISASTKTVSTLKALQDRIKRSKDRIREKYEKKNQTKSDSESNENQRKEKSDKNS
jgi:hypothetical protein